MNCRQILQNKDPALITGYEHFDEGLSARTNDVLFESRNLLVL